MYRKMEQIVKVSCETNVNIHTRKRGTLKSHITRQHVKKTKKDDGAKPVETEEETLAALAEWDRPLEDEHDEEEGEQDEEENHEEGVVTDTEVAVILSKQ